MKETRDIRQLSWRFMSKLLLLLLLFGSNFPRGRAQTENPITILESTATSITLELRVDDFAWEAAPHGADPFYLVQIPGMGQQMVPGWPQLPTTGTLVGISSTLGVTLTLVDSAYETYDGYRLHPAPALLDTDNLTTPFAGSEPQEVFALDEGRYATDAFLPAALVELGEVGYLRDQPVAQVRFHPVQFNAAQNAVRIYRRLTARLSWAPSVEAAALQQAIPSPGFEPLLQRALLNYDSLARATAAPTVALPTTQGISREVGQNASPAFKIGVKRDGIYRLTAQMLRSAGLEPTTINPRNLHLSSHGGEIPFYIVGEEDGRFDEGDSLLFYGTHSQSPYTTINIYWLTLHAEPGLRMPIKDGKVTGAALSAPSFPVQLHAEEDTAYWQAMRDEGDRWFWGTRLGPNTQGLNAERIYTLSLNQIFAGATTAHLRVRLQGYTGLAHRTRIYLNDQLLDDQQWQGQAPFTHTITIAQTLLHNGENRVRVATIDTGSDIDQILVNWIELDYQDSYVAEGDQLYFGVAAGGRQKIAVQALSRQDVYVWDISDPTHPVIIGGPTILPEGKRYTLQFEDDATINSRYFAFTHDHFLSPTFLYADQPSTWRSGENGADYILITHESFYSSAAVLADQRRVAGLRVAVVGVQDIYDEFSDGLFDPWAIHDFLAYAYHNWQTPKPTYVLLLGDANQDYKDNLATQTPNYVPSWNMSSLISGEVSTDDWFAQVNGDDTLPDLLVGRLVAQSNEEARTIIDKIIAYERTPPDTTWNKRVLLVADDDESRFQELSEVLAAQLPYDYTTNRIYNLTGNSRQQIIDQLNAGHVLVNYAGHGEYFGWGMGGAAAGSIFHKDDVGALRNGGSLPVITVGNCLNGFFAGPKDAAALAEVLQRQPNGGAVALWAPSGLGYPTGHAILLQQFYSAIFQHDHYALGAATTAAKVTTQAQSSFWADLTQSYILFGDPATPLGIPPNAPYVRTTTPADGAVDVPLDAPIMLTFHKPVDPATVTLRATNDSALAFHPSWNKEQTIVRFTHDQFSLGQRYTFAVAGQDKQGNALRPGPMPLPWSFTVTTDGITPVATLAVPGGNSEAVTTMGGILLLFSEPVRPDSVRYTISPWVEGRFQWQADAQQAFFSHNRLTVGQRYTFTLDSALDRVGNELAQPISLSLNVIETDYVYLPYVQNTTASQ